MDASHPGTLCGSVLDARRPVSAVPGAPRGPKGAPKMRIVTFWPFRPPKRPRGRSSSKHKSYLRYREGLWRFNWDFNFFRFGSRKLATWADMGPPTGNRGAPGAKNGPKNEMFHILAVSSPELTMAPRRTTVGPRGPRVGPFSRFT